MSAQPLLVELRGLGMVPAIVVEAVVHEALYRITRRTASPMRWVRHMSLARVARGYLTAPRSAPVR